MRVRLFFLFAVICLAGNSGCSTAKRNIPIGENPVPSEETISEYPEEKTVITGVLEPTVEAGGWILKSDGEDYLLLGIAEYRKEEWFREGTRLKVWGKESPETLTIYMQGMPFSVSRIEPLDD